MMQDLRFLSNVGRTWVVVGHARFKQVSLSGILEWCYSKKDAEREVKRLSQDPRYSGLQVKEVG